MATRISTTMSHEDKKPASSGAYPTLAEQSAMEKMATKNMGRLRKALKQGLITEEEMNEILLGNSMMFGGPYDEKPLEIPGLKTEEE